MKKAINEKVYDTETAEYVDSRRENFKEFVYYTETLFQAEDGSYFLHVDALYNPLWYGKHELAKELYHSEIYPLSDEEAANWMAAGD